MSSFTFSDCPTTVALVDAERDGKKVSTGSLSLTVRNVTQRSLIGTLRVEPDDMAQSGWFKIAGASPTSPAERAIDCEANATQTVQVDIAVPEGAPAGRKMFSLRVATERDPDNDFTDSPAVAFDVKAPAPKILPKKAFPWWIVAVAVVAVVVVGGVFWVLRPKAAGASLVCPQGQTQDGRLCYAACPAGWDPDGATRCVQQCPSSWQGRSSPKACLAVTTTDTGGAASCPAGQTLDAGLCFKMPDGYRVISSGSIGKICPPDWKDDGNNCVLTSGSYQRKIYNNQGECVQQNGGTACDPVSMGPITVFSPRCRQYYMVVNRDTCLRSPLQESKDVHPHGGTPPDQCSGGQDLIGGTCFPRCSNGFKRADKGICSAICPAGFADLGAAGCQRPTQDLKGQDLTAVGVCPAATPVRTGDLCYLGPK